MNLLIGKKELKMSLSKPGYINLSDHNLLIFLETIKRVNVVFVTGAPGLGKTTFAVHLSKILNAVVTEADMFFMKNGVYCFDPSLLQRNHNLCKQEMQNIVNGGKIAIVTGTFCDYKHIWDYLETVKHVVDLKYTVIRMSGNRYQNVHRVPPHVVERMHILISHSPFVPPRFGTPLFRREILASFERQREDKNASRMSGISLACHSDDCGVFAENIKNIKISPEDEYEPGSNSPHVDKKANGLVEMFGDRDSQTLRELFEPIVGRVMKDVDFSDFLKTFGLDVARTVMREFGTVRKVARNVNGVQLEVNLYEREHYRRIAFLFLGYKRV